MADDAPAPEDANGDATIADAEPDTTAPDGAATDDVPQDDTAKEPDASGSGEDTGAPSGPLSSGGDDSGGCGCNSVQPTSSASWAPWLLGVLVLAHRRGMTGR